MTCAFFRKPFCRNLVCAQPMDKLTLVSIRQMNLDAFWARAKSTVQGNAATVAKGLKRSAEYGLTGPYF